VEKLHRDPTVGPRPMVGPEVKNGRSIAKDGAPERLRCGTIQKVSNILQRVSVSILFCVVKRTREDFDRGKGQIL